MSRSAKPQLVHEQWEYFRKQLPAGCVPYHFERALKAAFFAGVMGLIAIERTSFQSAKTAEQLQALMRSIEKELTDHVDRHNAETLAAFGSGAGSDRAH